MTCKDCFNCDVCGVWENAGSLKTQMERAETLECFKDKSKIVELPCKVGDNLYVLLDDYNLNKVILKAQAVTVEYCDKSYGRIWAEVESPKGTMITFEACDVGISVFLSPEEAEKALKEREVNGR